jgi:mycofactocin glycosyltransferase
MPGAPLDSGSRFRIDASIRIRPGADGTPVAVGGSPLRLLRLRVPADAIVAQLQSGLTLGAILDALPPERHAATHRFVASLVDRGVAHQIPEPDPTRRLDDVTIVIPVHNRAFELARLIATLATDRERGATLVIVDDGSTDESATVARSAGAATVRHATALGPAAARNAGATIATTTYVVFLDSDVEPTPGWLDLCLAHLDIAAADVVAPRVVGLADPTSASIVERYEHVRSALDLGDEPALIAPLTKVAYVPAAAFVVRRETFVRIGGFDESLHVGEDVDLLWRLHAGGAVLRYEPLARVAHDHRATLGAMLRRRFDYGTAAATLDARHPGTVPPAVISPWSVAVWAPLLVHPAGALVGLGIALFTGERLAQRLPMLRVADARRLAVRGHLAALQQTADALGRTWLPFALPVALVSKRTRLALATAIVTQGIRDSFRRKPPLDPARFVGIRALDDAAYGFGVATGSIRQRRVGALLPKFVNWPGRRRIDEDALC